MGPNHPHVSVSLNNLAGLLRMQGDNEAAKPLYERALGINERAFGEDSIKLATLLGNLAGALADLGDLDGALALQERALALRVRAFGPASTDVAVTLHNLAGVLRDLGRYDEVQPMLERALEIDEQALGADHPRVALMRTTLGRFLQTQGELPAAGAHLEAALKINLDRLGPANPDVSLSRLGLASLYDVIDMPNEARALREDALEHSTHFVTDLLPSLSEREALTLVAKLRPTLDQFVATAAAPEDARITWEATLRWKGAVARALSSRHDSALAADGDTMSALADVRRQLARQTLAGGEAEGLAALRQRQEILERELAQTGGESVALGLPSADQVCAALPADAVLVDFLRYPGRDGASYLAFIVTPDCTVQRIELGPTQVIDDLVEAHRDALAAGEHPPSTDRTDARGARLGEKIWAPLAAQIGGARHALLVPDGGLTGVSFATLPDQDGYLIERLKITYLESATDLLRWDSPREKRGDLLLVGGVDYGEGPGPTCLGNAFGPLPGTAVEIETIASGRRRGETHVLRGRDADEASVIAAMPSHHTLHLATHGFFAGEQCRSGLSDGIGFDPMVLSGVVLAHANTESGPLEPHDGILTAAEVSGLNLEQTELVVLSACETGLGEVRTGQGVLGLRRAFAASGARTLVMSLWAVPDESTATLMAEFYRAQRRRGPCDALREAQLAMLQRNRAEHNDGRPSDWGAFVAAGDCGR